MTNTEIKIDYLSGTFPMYIDEIDSVLFKIREWLVLFATFLNVKSEEILKCEYSHNHFFYEYQLGKYIILRFDGPLDKNYQKTAQIELKGDGCRDFERRNPDKTWRDLLLFLTQIQIKFKRIDLAIDDFNGDLVNFNYLHHKLINHDFYTSVFKNKPIPIGREEYGMSIQFGSNQSNTELVIYDKLQERHKRKVECDKEYWVRFEMRFRNENASSIAYEIVCAYESDESMQILAKEQLYRILDIKEDNNYNDSNQKQVPTDLKWKEFLDNVEKGEFHKIEKDKRILDLKEYGDHVSTYLMPLFIAMYITSGKDMHLTEVKFWQYLVNHMDLKKQQHHRINVFLNDYNIKTLDDNDISSVKKSIQDIIDDKELPF
ncbi:MAG: replication initiation factor domain-containing protein [Acholeplasmatales bacterium]|nr:replication initiation factor domain-containing protein [Acholeplasmatales bacterium]